MLKNKWLGEINYAFWSNFKMNTLIQFFQEYIF